MNIYVYSLHYSNNLKFYKIKMLVPVTCFSCGKVIGHLWEKYQELIHQENQTIKEALDGVCLTKSCCRTHLMSTVEVIENIIRDTGMIPEAMNDYRNGNLPDHVYQEIRHFEIMEEEDEKNKRNEFFMNED